MWVCYRWTNWARTFFPLLCSYCIMDWQKSTTVGLCLKPYFPSSISVQMLLLDHVFCFVLLSQAEDPVLTVVHLTALSKRALVHCFHCWPRFFFSRAGWCNLRKLMLIAVYLTIHARRFWCSHLNLFLLCSQMAASEELISLSLLGLDYHQNYYHRLLLSCITVAFLGWIAWLLHSLVDENNHRKNFLMCITMEHCRIIISWVSVILECSQGATGLIWPSLS
jgi:hypothetical protein